MEITYTELVIAIRKHLSCGLVEARDAVDRYLGREIGVPLDKRVQLAGLAMQAIIPTYATHSTPEARYAVVALEARGFADALAVELAKPTENVL